MLKSTALILLVAVSLHVSSTSAKSVWAKRESNPVHTVNVIDEDIPNVVNSGESEVSNADDSDEPQVDEEFLKDFLFVISKIIVSSDNSNESDDAEVEKALEDFVKKHPGSEKFWEYFVTTMVQLAESSEESSESVKSKRSNSIARFGRQTNDVNELRKLF